MPFIISFDGSGLGAIRQVRFRKRHCESQTGVVDLMGVKFDLPETEVKHKEWLGCGPYRVWKNRIHGPQLGVWANDYNDPVPGESFDYPEFKGYFAGVQWMKLNGAPHPHQRTTLHLRKPEQKHPDSRLTSSSRTVPEASP